MPHATAAIDAVRRSFFPGGGMLKVAALTLYLFVCLVATLSAQEPVQAAADSVRSLDLPDDVADAVFTAFNDPAWLRLMGTATIAAGDTIRADVAALEGPLVLGGHVAGSVLVVNGDLELLPGASVDGDVRVVGGTATGIEGARIGGEIAVYSDRLRYRREGGRIVQIEDPRASGVSGVLEWGRSDFLIATGDSYNRVEGLPITFGPRVRTAGSNPLRLHALAIYRTETGVRIDTDDLGYYVRAEQFIGGHREFRVGGTAHSLVEPIEDWQITDLESGLSTFFFHRDFRDHFERVGVSLFATWSTDRSPLSFTGEVRHDRHRSLAAGSPWSLFRNAEAWRPQPLVGEGRVTTARLSGEFDTRSDPFEPAAGWLVRGHVDQALSSDLVYPSAFTPDPLNPEAPSPLIEGGASFGRFSRGMIDIRRYNRVDPRSRLNFRLLMGGSLDGDPLPPQFQHSLGGEGSLPGYDLFSRDCQARTRTVFRSASAATDPLASPYFPRYGCDAFALLQAEYRGRFSFRMRWDSAPWLDDREEAADLDERETWEFAPDWTVFVDAGRGWNLESATDEDLAVDVGLGLAIGRLGAFIALPLTGEGGINAFIRLGPRF
jgi:hypothetical protein